MASLKLDRLALYGFLGGQVNVTNKSDRQKSMGHIESYGIEGNMLSMGFNWHVVDRRDPSKPESQPRWVKDNLKTLDLDMTKFQITRIDETGFLLESEELNAKFILPFAQGSFDFWSVQRFEEPEAVVTT